MTDPLQSFENFVQPAVSDGIGAVVSTVDDVVTQIESTLGDTLSQLGLSVDDLNALSDNARTALASLLQKLDEIKTRKQDMDSLYTQLRTQITGSSPLAPQVVSLLRRLYFAMSDVNRGVQDVMRLLGALLDTVPDQRDALRQQILAVAPGLARWI